MDTVLLKDVPTPIKFRENNGSFEVLNGKSEYLGLISQNPNKPGLMDPGKWTLSLHDDSGGINGFGPFETAEEAKAEVFAHIQFA